MSVSHTPHRGRSFSVEPFVCGTSLFCTWLIMFSVLQHPCVHGEVVEVEDDSVVGVVVVVVDDAVGEVVGMSASIRSWMASIAELM